MGIKAQASPWEEGLTLAPHLEGGLSPLSSRTTAVHCPAGTRQRQSFSKLALLLSFWKQKGTEVHGRSAERPAPQLTEHSAPGWPMLQNTKDSKMAELGVPPL